MTSQKKQRRTSADAELDALVNSLHAQIHSEEVLSLKTSDERLWTRVLRTARGRYFTQLLHFDASVGHYRLVWTSNQEKTLAPAEEAARKWIENYEQKFKTSEKNP